jgi:signal peptidase I
MSHSSEAGARPAAHRWWPLARLLDSLLGSVVVALFFVTFIAQAFQIPSASMESTLKTGDYLLVDKAVYGAGAGLLPYREVTRGDVIVFRYPPKPQLYFVKRVVAVPGDRVRMVNKGLYVNGRPAGDPYAVHSDRRYDFYRDDFPELRWIPASVDARWRRQLSDSIDDAGELVVPPGSYFVLGDNRDNSQDSRYWGFVPRANVVGRPLIIYWSLRSDDPASALTAARGDTLSSLAYTVTHLNRYTRWDRMLRIVR